jgi:hypothetical protein
MPRCLKFLPIHWETGKALQVPYPGGRRVKRFLQAHEAAT